MAFTIDKCDNFDGNKCTKCGRMMPDLCKDQQALEEKAKKYDELMGSQTLLEEAAEQVEIATSSLVSDDVSSVTEGSEPEEATEPVFVQTTDTTIKVAPVKRPVPKTLKGAPKK